MTSPQNPWNRPDAYGGQQWNPWGQPSSGPGGQYPVSGGFPQSTGPPGGGAQPPPGGTERPTTVEAAFWVSVVIPLLSTVLAVVSYLLLLNFVGNLFDAAAPESSTAAPQPDGVLSQIRTFMLGVFIFLTVVYLVLTALWILFGFKMRAGKNWARVTLTVFAGLWVLSSVGSLPSAGGMTAFSSADLPGGVEPPGGLIALGYVQAAIGLAGMIAFVVLAFVGPSTRYFRVMSGQNPAAAPGYPAVHGYPGPGR